MDEQIKAKVLEILENRWGLTMFYFFGELPNYPCNEIATTLIDLENEGIIESYQAFGSLRFRMRGVERKYSSLVQLLADAAGTCPSVVAKNARMLREMMSSYVQIVQR